METMTAKQQINLTKEMKAKFLQVLKNNVITQPDADFVADNLEDAGLMNRKTVFMLDMRIPAEDGEISTTEQRTELTKEMKAVFLQILSNKVINKADADLMAKIFEGAGFGSKVIFLDMTLPEDEK